MEEQLKEKGLTDSNVNILVEQGFANMDDLTLLDEPTIKELNFNLQQQLLLKHIVHDLQVDQSESPLSKGYASHRNLSLGGKAHDYDDGLLSPSMGMQYGGSSVNLPSPNTLRDSVTLPYSARSNKWHSERYMTSPRRGQTYSPQLNRTPPSGYGGTPKIKITHEGDGDEDSDSTDSVASWDEDLTNQALNRKKRATMGSMKSLASARSTYSAITNPKHVAGFLSNYAPYQGPTLNGIPCVIIDLDRVENMLVDGGCLYLVPKRMQDNFGFPLDRSHTPAAGFHPSSMRNLFFGGGGGGTMPPGYGGSSSHIRTPAPTTGSGESGWATGPNAMKRHSEFDVDIGADEQMES